MKTCFVASGTWNQVLCKSRAACKPISSPRIPTKPSIPGTRVVQRTSRQWFMSAAPSAPTAEHLYVVQVPRKAGSIGFSSAHIQWVRESAITKNAQIRFIADREDKTGLFGIVSAQTNAGALDALVKNDPDTFAVYSAEQSQVDPWKLVIQPKRKMAGNLFAVVCKDKEDSLAVRMSNRPAHLDWIQHSGKNVFAGPFISLAGEIPQPYGSLLVVQGSSADEIRSWSKDDPYAIAGLFHSVDVIPLSEAFSDQI